MTCDAKRFPFTCLSTQKSSFRGIKHQAQIPLICILHTTREHNAKNPNMFYLPLQININARLAATKRNSPARVRFLPSLSIKSIVNNIPEQNVKCTNRKLKCLQLDIDQMQWLMKEVKKVKQTLILRQNIYMGQNQFTLLYLLQNSTYFLHHISCKYVPLHFVIITFLLVFYLVFNYLHYSIVVLTTGAW